MTAHSAYELVKRIESFDYIPTGSLKLDEKLGGGMQCGVISEVHGASGSGKTRMCLELILNTVTINKKNQVIYITTKRTFTPDALRERINYIASRQSTLRSSNNKTFDYDLNPASFLCRIHHVNVATVQDLAFVLNEAIRRANSCDDIKLIAVDSFATYFRSIMSFKVVCLIQQILAKLNEIAVKNNIAILLSNDVTLRPVLVRGKFKSVIFPSLGEIFAHRLHQSFYLRKSKRNSITLQIVKSKSFGSGCVKLKIDGKRGIMDTEDESAQPMSIN